MRSLTRIALRWGTVGATIAIVLFVAGEAAMRLAPAAIGGFVPLALLVWPTSFWLMATESATTGETVLVVALAILANFVLYFLVALLLAAIYRAVNRSERTAKES